MIRYAFYGDIMCGGTCCINERFILFKFSFVFSYLSREIRNCMNNPGKKSAVLTKLSMRIMIFNKIRIISPQSILLKSQSGIPVGIILYGYIRNHKS